MKIAITGAYSYSGKYITRRLLARGHEVITLTAHPNRTDEFKGKLKTYPFNFDNPGALRESLQGVDVLYNTYWVRFNHPIFNHADAVTNILALFDAAKKAGVKRVVHISITNPDENSHLEYFSGKGRLERGLIESGLSYAILRPTVIFGDEDVLINNIAWALRHLPVFGVFGDGNYKLQPIYVEDLADLAVEQGEKTENVIIDAIGPETFSYRELVNTIGQLIGRKRPLISVPPTFGYIVAQLIGWITGDVFVTRPEIEGLMANLLFTNSKPTGKKKLTDWIREHSDKLGKHYANELKRRQIPASAR